METGSISFSVEGAWELVRFEMIDQEGIRTFWGEKASGLLIYTPDGYMSVSIHSQAIFRSEDAKEILDGILFYSGRYQVQGHEIRHQVLHASDPHRIGSEMVREARFNDGLMTLTARGDFGVAALCWRRI
jgi:hypothetical protein